MAEFCLDCLNKIMGTDNQSVKYIISKEPELCEGCGELKPVVIRAKRACIAAEQLRASFSRFIKAVNK